MGGTENVRGDVAVERGGEMVEWGGVEVEERGTSSGKGSDTGNRERDKGWGMDVVEELSFSFDAVQSSALRSELNEIFGSSITSTF